MIGFLVGIPVLSFPFSLTTKIIILCLTALPLVLLALIGVSGGSLSTFILLFSAIYEIEGFCPGIRRIRR